MNGRAVVVAWAHAAVLAAAGAGAGGVQAQIVVNDRLTVNNALAEVEISSFAGVLAADSNALLASASSGANSASADHAAGLLRGRATIADSVADTLLSSAAYMVELQNTGARAASLAGAGALALEVDASFLRNLGQGLGLAGNTLVATLVVVVLDGQDNKVFEGAGSLAYTVTHEVGDAQAELGFTPTLTGGFTLGPVLSSADLLAVDIIAPALQVQPGHRLALAAQLSGSATAFGFLGGSGFSADTDFRNTARLRLELPQGFGLASDVPLDWVRAAPVPEPPALLLLALGLAPVGFAARRRRR